ERLLGEHPFRSAAWVDLSHVWPRRHITLDDVRGALEKAEVTLKPGMTLLYTTGIGKKWDDTWTFLSDYPGLDEEASAWLLDQGLVNLGTDAVSTDTPTDNSSPNHMTQRARAC